MVPSPYRPGLAVALLLLLFLLSCHDAPRTNPFDPALTPAVELSVALDDTAGTATLTWSRYEGQQPFREYRVLRNIADRKSVDTLVHIAAVAQTAFVDTTLAPNTAYVYRVETVNAGGYAAPSEEKGIAGYAAGPVNLVEVEVDAHQGQTRLRWTHFTGARFQGYRVERRSGEEERFSVVWRLSGLSDTTWTDAELTPEVSYFYQVVVEAAGSDWPSTSSSRQGFSLAPVQLVSVEINKSSGKVRLRWTPFQGPDFEGYRVERRSEKEVDFGMIGWLEAVADTAYTDTTLAPEVSYFYRVVVEAGGRDWSSAPSSPQGFELRGVNVSILPSSYSTQGISLGWLQFFGPGFQRYRVLRRVVGTDVEETIAELTQRTIGEETAFTDTSARFGVEYEYWVVVDAAGQEVVGTRVVASFDLPPSAMKPPVFSAATASAALRWSLYQGPHFRAYRVERRTAGLVPQVVAEIPDKTVLSYVDADLAGNTEYFYRVVVLTTRDEEVASEEVSGGIHPLVDTWPLGAEVHASGRLYVEPADRIAALVYRDTRPWILTFDPEGQLLEEWMVPVVGSLRSYFSTADGATSLSREGRRFFGLRVSDNFGILAFGPDKQPLVQERALFSDAFPNLSDPEKVVQGEISLKGNNTQANFIDNVRVSAGGRELFVENFEEFPLGSVEKPPHNWELKGGNATVFSQGLLSLGTDIRITRADETWNNFRLEADEESYGLRSPSIEIGGDSFSRFSLALDLTTQQAFLDWEFSPPGELNLQPQESSLSLPIEIMNSVFYGLSLEALDGVVNASMKDPVLWIDRDADPVASSWSSLALVGDLLAFTRDDQIYNLTQAGEVVSQFQFGDPISETRVWENPKDGAPWIGVCMPDLDQITMSRVPSNTANWPRFVSPALAVKLGPELGSTAGTLLYPSSFAVGPDGRFYVLDAGNARVVVFDADRQYLTQWGHRGSDEGDFDFGKGLDLNPDGGTVRHYAGSIAVDSEGYIYVLDVFNQRIQRFAP